MEKLICFVFGHKAGESHLDYIYGSLAREHITCIRCEYTVLFECPTEERESELLARGGFIGDGAVSGCNPF